jgi:transcriptional regulator with XRE-family HTH domain
MNDLGEKLKVSRIEKSLTQLQVSESLNVSRQAVSNWETNKNYPDIVSIVLLSQLYNISLDELLKGEKGMVKNMKKDLDKINSLDMLVLIMMLVLAFIIPFLGIGFAIYLLLKFRLDIYPRWVRTVAIVAFVYQIVLLSGVFLQYLFFLQILRKVFKILKEDWSHYMYGE